LTSGENSMTAADKKWALVVAKAWADEEFKRQLLADPAAVLRAEGLPVRAGMTVRIIEDSEQTCTLVLPPQPADGSGMQNVENRLAALKCG
jgi:hypothetical protein